MKNKFFWFFVLVAVGFLTRTTYHFAIISVDGGIILSEPNIYVAVIECVLAFVTLLVLFIAFIYEVFKDEVNKNEN